MNGWVNGWCSFHDVDSSCSLYFCPPDAPNRSVMKPFEYWNFYIKKAPELHKCSISPPLVFRQFRITTMLRLEWFEPVWQKPGECICWEPQVQAISWVRAAVWGRCLGSKCYVTVCIITWVHCLKRKYDFLSPQYSLGELEEMKLCLQQFNLLFRNMEERFSEERAAAYNALSDADR